MMLDERLDPATCTRGNTSFSRQLPGLQLAVDSTSLGNFKTCHRFYYYLNVLGFAPREESVHLRFGILLHGARERYDHWRFAGRDHEDALRDVVAWLLRETWDAELKRGWVSGHSTKNRLTLLRTVVWYLDQFGPQDPIKTVVLANGKPAVELSFKFDSGYRSYATGEPFTLCGHLDRLGELNNATYVVDLKSTGYTLGPQYFAQYKVHNQFSLYSVAGRVVFQTPVSGLIVDAARVLATTSEFQRALVSRDEAQLSEWLADTGKWLAKMEACAEESQTEGERAYEMNDKNCIRYGRACEFLEVCGRTPAARPQWLLANYVRRQWDPLIARGDI